MWKKRASKDWLKKNKHGYGLRFVREEMQINKKCIKSSL